MPFCVKNDSDIYHTRTNISYQKTTFLIQLIVYPFHQNAHLSFVIPPIFVSSTDGHFLTRATLFAHLIHVTIQRLLKERTWNSITMSSNCILTQIIQNKIMFMFIIRLIKTFKVRESLACESSYIVLRGSSATILYWYPIASHISNINFKKHLSSHQVEFICFWGCIVEVLNGAQ